jgi:hypothetical protein
VADTLALSRAVDFGEVGITGGAAVSIARFFGNRDDEEDLEQEPAQEPLAEPEGETHRVYPKLSS